MDKRILPVLLKYLDSPEDALKLAEKMKVTKVKRGDCFVYDGQPATRIALVLTGVFRYITLKDGDEITTYFSLPGTFMVSVQPFFTGQNSIEQIEAITDSEIAYLDKEIFKKILSSHPRLYNMYTYLLESLLVCMDESRHDLLTLSPVERYEKWIRQEPDLLQYVPQKYLATMLGITPRHLSRIRSGNRAN